MARILIVDDTKNIRRMIEMTLVQAGHETGIAIDGEEGLQKFGDGSAWDLTIVDQRMPKLEGRAFVREARNRDANARIIMMTAFATTELATEIMKNGALDFLRKPFSTDVLRGAVKAALAHEIDAPQTSQILESNDENSTETPENASASATKSIPQDAPRKHVSYQLNGFGFWPHPESSTRKAPQNLPFGVLFRVRNPEGDVRDCFVGVTEHIRLEMQSEIGREFPADDEFWDEICGAALSDFVWSQAKMPPAVLPVYELPKKLRIARRSPVAWGPFTHGR